LKIGRKSLYVFDKLGETQHVIAPCVLDFYIHESRQRHGLGKVLFEHMLDMENLLPEKLAIDRPSEKLLGFLMKHYGEFSTFQKKSR
jgi:alpha-tubulin N-acetyltransferase 1